MAVHETTDAYLFLQVAENDKVILKYHTDECGEVCKEFVIIFKELSEETKYNNVVFLSINADDNPAAKERIMKTKQPVITIYSKGRLRDSRHASDREGVETLLKELQEIN